MLSVFTNLNELLATNKTTVGNRLQIIDTSLMAAKYFGVTLSGSNNSNVKTEFHLYTTTGNYIAGDHNITTKIGYNDTTNNDVAPEFLSVDFKSKFTDNPTKPNEFKNWDRCYKTDLSLKESSIEIPISFQELGIPKERDYINISFFNPNLIHLYHILS